MTKSFLKTIGLLAITLFLLIGCGNEKTTVTTIEKPTVIKKTETPKTVKIETHAAKKATSVVKKDFDLGDVFKDSARIAPKGKYMIIIFGSDECPYCTKMKNDIHDNKKLKDELKNDFTTYLLNIKNNKIHKLQHEGKDLDVDTKTLIDIYSVRATPTLIFTDEKGKSIFVVPGYIPAKQFLITLDFVKDQKWLGLDRKNGDVYKALKNYYIDHGLANIIKKKK
ncbi:MAG: thioredoxin fold domain-containing protein [Sulfurospirillum sp.]